MEYRDTALLFLLEHTLDIRTLPARFQTHAEGLPHPLWLVVKDAAPDINDYLQLRHTMITVRIL